MYLSVLAASLTNIGVFSKLGDVGEERLKVFDFNPDPTVRHTFWTLVLGAIPQFFYTAITQAGVQRIISTPDLKTAKRIVYIAAPVYCIVWLMTMFEGISVFAYFQTKRCDPIKTGQIENPNQIVPLVMMELFHNYRGVPGLFIAAMAAASLSTISSGLSGLAAVTCIDILQVVKPNISDHVATNLSKLFVIMYGSITVAIAFIMSNVQGPLGQIMAGFTGAVAGPETGMFLVSVFFRRSRPKAVIISSLFVLAMNIWLLLGQTFSSGTTQTPYLPLAPIDKCPPSGNLTTNVSSASNSLFPSIFNSYSPANTTFSHNLSIEAAFTTVRLPAQDESMSLLDILYSISYMYFHLLGTIVTIVLAILGSLLTQPDQPDVVNEACILSLSSLVSQMFKR